MGMTSSIEYRIVWYVPDVMSNNCLSLAVIFTDSCDPQDGVCAMNVAESWQAEVRHIDPHCDLKMIEALLSEIHARLLSRSERSDMIRQLEDSFSNLVQVSDRHKLPSEWRLDSLEEFAHELLGNSLSTSDEVGPGKCSGDGLGRLYSRHAHPVPNKETPCPSADNRT